MAPTPLCGDCLAPALDGRPLPWSIGPAGELLDASGEAIDLPAAFFAEHPGLAWRILFDAQGVVADLNWAFTDEGGAEDDAA